MELLPEVLARLDVCLKPGESVTLMTDQEGYWSADLGEFSDPLQHKLVLITCCAHYLIEDLP